MNEILRQVAREKDIDLERWIAALEDAMASAAKKQHRIKEPVRSRLDRDTGRFEAFIVKKVVAEVEDPLAEWTVEEAQDHKAGAQVGDEIHLPIPTDGLGRIAAQSAKQVLYQRVREAERENIYNEYIDRVGEVLNGTVKRFERGDIVVDLGRTEAVVPRSEQARHERYSQGERIRAVIVEVHKQPKGPQIVLSRTDPRLLVKLFETEVPEIYDGTVVIKNAVRAPGERAKVAVYSRERDVDPVGACVGMKGSRVQSIIRELRGEKIDIIEYSDDLVTFAQSALAPAKITRVSVTHQGEVPHLDVIVEDEQLSLAIGKRGQNVRLASELIGARIDIKSESDVKDEVADALARMLQTALGPSAAEVEAAAPPDLGQAPGVTPELREALEAAGFATVENLAERGREALLEVPGIDEELADGLMAWAGEQAVLAAEAAAAAAAAAAQRSAAEHADIGLTFRRPQASSSMGDEDFMAALSRAFQESEAQRATRDAGAAAEADDAADLAASAGSEEAAEPAGDSEGAASHTAAVATDATAPAEAAAGPESESTEGESGSKGR
ncbi:MAG TPA: transcription termination factor NusA [Thermoanaerobaculia bacterium]|nr:transcription termination factor NusA [Thermoanaerobaculia bacterium]